jgi:hypothetical protein
MFFFFQDFLSIPLDNAWDQNDKKSSNQDENLNTVNHHVDSSTKQSDTTMFDDFDDEMMLSIVENADSTLNKTAQNSTFDDNSSLLHSNRERKNETPTSALAPAKKKSVQERIESFVSNKSGSFMISFAFLKFDSV